MQLLQPLFEFSGACAGCGETPYIKLLTQLFGDRAVIANATGCSSIYGGNLPTTPYSINTRRAAARPGPTRCSRTTPSLAWACAWRWISRHDYARELVQRFASVIGDELVGRVTGRRQIRPKRNRRRNAQRVVLLKQKLAGTSDARKRRDLLSLADALVEKSVWIVGGDGWAYDIGFGGLDHVLASGANVNILVLDTEVYSNTGGQMSKATPRGAVAKFAAGGKRTAKKDLAMLAMTYGNVYVARIAMGGSDMQTIKAFLEAEAYRRTVADHRLQPLHRAWLRHGAWNGAAENRGGLRILAVAALQSTAGDQGKNPLQLDSRAPSLAVNKYMYNETRFSMPARSDPRTAADLAALAQTDVDVRWKHYADMAAVPGSEPKPEDVRLTTGKEK